jgi:hypothetical protein
LTLPEEFKTPLSDPEYRSIKTLAQGKKALEFLIETTEEVQVAISKWSQE